MRLPRYSLKTLLASVLVIAAAMGLLLNYWTRPYCITGTYSNGVRAWEQWEVRTLTMKIAHVKTVRYYSSGEKMMVVRNRYKTRGDGVHLTTIGEAYWSPTGEQISSAKTRKFRAEDPLGSENPEPDNELPFEDLIWWWNGW